MTAPTVKCTLCDAPIAWAVTEAGKPIALDPDPSDEGTLYVLATPKLVAADRGPVAKLAASRGLGKYVKHSETCEMGAAQRKKRRDAAKEIRE